MQNWNNLYSFVHVAPFVQKQTFVRIDYLRTSRDLFANMPLIMLKHCLKSWQCQCWFSITFVEKQVYWVAACNV